LLVVLLPVLLVVLFLKGVQQRTDLLESLRVRLFQTAIEPGFLAMTEPLNTKVVLLCIRDAMRITFPVGRFVYKCGRVKSETALVFVRPPVYGIQVSSRGIEIVAKIYLTTTQPPNVAASARQRAIINNLKFAEDALEPARVVPLDEVKSILCTLDKKPILYLPKLCANQSNAGMPSTC
jgi:hypothetical protein